MQWYYRWKLRRIRREIHTLEDLSRFPLTEDYTASSRLRILQRLEAHLQNRLNDERSSTAPPPGN